MNVYRDSKPIKNLFIFSPKAAGVFGFKIAASSSFQMGEQSGLVHQTRTNCVLSVQAIRAEDDRLRRGELSIVRSMAWSHVEQAGNKSILSTGQSELDTRLGKFVLGISNSSNWLKPY